MLKANQFTTSHHQNTGQGYPWWPSGWEPTCQGRRRRVNPWPRTISHAAGQPTKPARPNYRGLHAESPCSAMRSQCNEKLVHHHAEQPPPATRERPCIATKTQHSHKEMKNREQKPHDQLDQEMQKKHLTKFNTHSWWITKQTRNSKGPSSTWERLHEKLTRNITLSGEHQQSKTENSPPKISNKTRMPALASQWEGQSRKEHEAKGILAAKEVKLSLMTDDTIIIIHKRSPGSCSKTITSNTQVHPGRRT